MKKISSLSYRLLAPVLFMAAASAQAASFSVIPVDGANKFQAPPGELMLDYLETGVGPNQGTDERDVKESRDNAQTFTIASTFTLDKIAINFESATFNEANRFATFQFFQVSDPESASLSILDDVILDSVTFSPFDLGMAAGTLVFDVEDTIVSAGSHFGIRFDTDESTPLVFKWNFAPVDTYNRYEGGKLSTVNESYTVGLIAVPEPSTYAILAGLGALVCAAARRRR